MSGDAVVDRREGRRLFGLDPEQYERARPGHPARVFDLLRERCGVGAGTAAVEVGPGTGQATRRLLELGVDRLVAVEPDPQLARYLESALGERVAVRVAALEDVELEDEAFDVAVAASSFHWVEQEVGLARLYAALRPGAWIALWWTIFGDDERPDPFRAAVDPVMRELASSPSEGRRRGIRFPLDADARSASLRSAGFSDVGHELTRWSHEWDAAGIRALFATFSPVARLEVERREALLDEIARVATDDFGGRVEKPIVTSLYTARKPA
jgi:SAM-dependent methyltransferase